MTDRVEAETVTHLCYKVIGHVSEGKALWDADFGSIIDTLRALLAERDALLASQGYTYIGKDRKPILARVLEDQRDALAAENQRLRETGQAVVDRWDTPLWKEAEATGRVINRLRAALAEQESEDDK